MAVHGVRPRGEVIAAIRKGRGESRSSLAKRAGISYKHLHGIEVGRHKVSEEALNRIATALAVGVVTITAPDEADAKDGAA
jgi:transcriptional regulator with XRE-family HTH domain